MYRRCTIYLEYYYSERECKGAGTCPCMEINVSVQYNGGLLPDIMLSTRCVFLKNEEEAIPPGEKKYLGTIKPMEINVSVQYNEGLLPDIMLSTRCNYIKYLGTVKASTRMILVHVVQKMYKTCTEDVQYI